MTSEGAKRQKLYIQAEKATLLLLAQTEKAFQTSQNGPVGHKKTKPLVQIHPLVRFVTARGKITAYGQKSQLLFVFAAYFQTHTYQSVFRLR